MKENSYKQLLRSLDSPPVPNDLEERILRKIDIYRKRSKHIQYLSWLITSVVAVGCTVYTVVNLHQALTESGTYSYLSLAYTDGSSLFSFLKEFLLTLAESLPALSAAAFLGATAFAIWSLAKIINLSKSKQSSYVY